MNTDREYRQKLEIRNQKSEIRNQKSEIRIVEIWNLEIRIALFMPAFIKFLFILIYLLLFGSSEYLALLNIWLF